MPLWAGVGGQYGYFDKTGKGPPFIQLVGKSSSSAKPCPFTGRVDFWKPAAAFNGFSEIRGAEFGFHRGPALAIVATTQKPGDGVDKVSAPANTARSEQGAPGEPLVSDRSHPQSPESPVDDTDAG